MTPLEAVGARASPDLTLGVLRSAGLVGIVGSRAYPELHRVRQLVALLPMTTVVISGGADGVDAAAMEAVVSRGLAGVDMIPSGRERPEFLRAIFARNLFLALCSDVVVAFWDGSSHGTADTIRRALKMGKCVVALPGQPARMWEPV
jgi:predicted Rossmann fold nucleotide-binding protein DprA/Smf involved in DNA uptake